MRGGRGLLRRGLLSPPLGVFRRLDRCLTRLLIRSTNIQEPLPEAVLRELRRLRGPVALCALLFVAAVGMELYSAAKGWYLLMLEVPKECLPLEHWLLGYCVALTMLPFCFAVAAPLVIWWSANGGLIRANLPASCRHEAPALWDFVDQVLLLTVLTSSLAALAAILMWLVSRRLNHLRNLWGSGGAAIAAAVERIVVDSPSEAPPPGTECCICLTGPGEGEERWLRLVCDHYFHEPCLVEWLRAARRCPLCRRDLQQAYLTDAPAGGPAEAPAAGGRPERVEAAQSEPAPPDLENPAAAEPGASPSPMAVALLSADQDTAQGLPSS